MRSKYPIPRWIYIDVDDTLIKDGVLNQYLIDWCKQKKDEGYKLVLWSARGNEYATQVATTANITGIFDYIISKPGFIVDDDGWRWANFVPNLDVWR